jgi:hypothetical protein
MFNKDWLPISQDLSSRTEVTHLVSRLSRTSRCPAWRWVNAEPGASQRMSIAPRIASMTHR